MRKNLILVKHSLPEIREDLPAREWTLSKEGHSRAGQLAERLTPYLPQILVSSPEPKAMETAGMIARKHHMSLHILHDLHEHDRSNVPYLSKQEFEEAVREFFKNPDRRVLGTESAEETHDRFSRAIQSVLTTYVDRTIVVVSHGTVISLFVSRLTDTSDEWLWTQLGMPGYVVLDLQSKSLVALEPIVQ
jgi:2,3-bisphosphoglycerate-dependent phosphoglycerate mutase